MTDLDEHGVPLEVNLDACSHDAYFEMEGRILEVTPGTNVALARTAVRAECLACGERWYVDYGPIR